MRDGLERTGRDPLHDPTNQKGSTVAIIAVPTTFVILNEISNERVVDPRNMEALVFASAPAARLAMRDLALSPRLYRITEHPGD